MASPRAGALRVLFTLPFLLALGAPAADSPFGLNIHAPEGVDRRTALDAAPEARASWVRIDLLWSRVEPSRGSFDFSAYDALLDEAAACGLSVYATVGSTPAWATDGPRETGVPRTASDFADFVRLAAARWGGRVAVWGFWNE